MIMKTFILYTTNSKLHLVGKNVVVKDILLLEFPESHQIPTKAATTINLLHTLLRYMTNVELQESVERAEK